MNTVFLCFVINQQMLMVKLQLSAIYIYIYIICRECHRNNKIMLQFTVLVLVFSLV